MTPEFRQKAIAICTGKIAKKGEGVGLSFYAFFKNKIQQMEEQVKIFVEGEQRQYVQKLQEKDQLHLQKMDEKEQRCSS